MIRTRVPEGLRREAAVHEPGELVRLVFGESVVRPAS